MAKQVRIIAATWSVGSELVTELARQNREGSGGHTEPRTTSPPHPIAVSRTSLASEMKKGAFE